MGGPLGCWFMCQLSCFWSVLASYEKIGVFLKNRAKENKCSATIVLNQIHFPRFKRMSDSANSTIDWAAALELHRPWLCQVLRCRVSDRHAVEDLFQEIALAVFRNAKKAVNDRRPSDPEKVAPWLYRLAVRQAINFHRKSGRKSRAHPVENLDPLDTQSSPLDWLMDQEKQTDVVLALNTLKPVDRELLMLKYTENWNYRQIAEHLGVKIGTVEYRLHTARKQLRKQLAAKLPNMSPAPPAPLAG